MNDGILGTTGIKAKNPRKQLHRIYDKTLVIIDESLVKRFGIDDENAWVEQEPVEGGILLHIYRLNTQKENDTLNDNDDGE